MTAFEEATRTADRGTTTVAVRAFTRDRIKATRAAIASVLNQNHPPDELLVVIDHNEPLRAELSTELAGNDRVRVIPNQRRRGIGGGSNTALLAARGDIIAYLDDDAVAEADWLGSLLTAIDEPDVVGVAGHTVPNWVDGHQPDWFPDEFLWTVGCSIDGESTPRRSNSREIRNVWGGNNAFRRGVVVAHGGFIESGLGRIGSHPVGGEDTEICIRIRQERPKSRFLYEPGAVIHHEVPADRATLTYFRSRCFHEGVSKALLSHHRGSRQSLNEEVDYTRRLLVGGVRRSMAEAARKRSVAPLGRAGAIALGLASAAGGLAYGRARILAGSTQPLAEVRTPLEDVSDNTETHRA